LARPEGNKGNLQFLAGEIIQAWAIGNIQTPGDHEINDKASFTLEALAYAKIRDDVNFQKEFQALDDDTTTRMDLRYRQIRLLIWKLADCGVLTDKGVPVYGLDGDDAE